MELKKGQKQGRDERMQEEYLTSAKIHCRCTHCRVVFLCSFASALFLSFFQVQPEQKWSFTETFSLVSVLFRGFLNHFPSRRRTLLLCWRWTLFAWERTRYALVTNSLKTSIQNSAPPHTHTATYAATCTSDFQTELVSRLLLTGTHLRKQAVATCITLSYSPPSMLHPQFISTCTCTQ